MDSLLLLEANFSSLCLLPCPCVLDPFYFLPVRICSISTPSFFHIIHHLPCTSSFPLAYKLKIVMSWNNNNKKHSLVFALLFSSSSLSNSLMNGSVHCLHFPFTCILHWNPASIFTIPVKILHIFLLKYYTMVIWLLLTFDSLMLLIHLVSWHHFPDLPIISGLFSISSVEFSFYLCLLNINIPQVLSPAI